VYRTLFDSPMRANLSNKAFANAAVNRLTNMLTVILCRRVTVESCDAFQRHLGQWAELVELLGLSSGETREYTVVLTPGCKAVLLYATIIARKGEKKTAFKVRRDNVFFDCCQALRAQQILNEGGNHKVFPAFYSEEHGRQIIEHGEGHGPRKEFFQLAGEDLGKDAGAALGLFTFNRTAGCFWFNDAAGVGQTEDKLHQYEVLGWLMGNAICNRATIRLPLPTVLFTKLIAPDFTPTLEMVEAFDPATHSSMAKIKTMSQSEFEGLIEFEDCKGMSREQYLNRAVSHLLVDDVSWQFAALQRGFNKVIDLPSLHEWAISPPELHEMICGLSESSSDFMLRDIFRVVVDEELDSCKELSGALWQVLDGWPPELKRKFVRFVTGSARLPLPGSELMRIELPFVSFSLREQRTTLGMLPQAHTCENILELPNYWEALCQVRGDGTDTKLLAQELPGLIDERLRLGIEHCTEYDLDGAAATAISPGVRPAAISMTASATIVSTNVSWSPQLMEASDEVMEWVPSPVPSPMPPATPVHQGRLQIDASHAIRRENAWDDSAAPQSPAERIKADREHRRGPAPSPTMPQQRQQRDPWASDSPALNARDSPIPNARVYQGGGSKFGYTQSKKKPDEVLEKDVDLLLQELDLDF